jgi:antitoxin VapB
MKATAQLFKNGGSQAIRLPKQFRFPGKTVTLQKTRSGVLIKAADDLERRVRILRSLAGSCPEFPEIQPNLTPDLPREPMI